MIVMSNFFEFLIKLIKLYLIKANTNLCRIVYRSQNLCIFRDFDNSLNVFFINQNIKIIDVFEKISCSFRVCYTFLIFLINRHYKTNIKSKKMKILRNFNLHRKRFDHSSIHCKNRETIKQKIVNSIDYSIRNFFFHVVYQFNM